MTTDRKTLLSGFLPWRASTPETNTAAATAT